MRRSLFVVIGLVAMLAGALLVWRRATETPVVDTGVSHALALSRASVVSDLRYAVSFTIPESRTAPIIGRITASFTLGDTPGALAFDFTQPADHLRTSTANGNAFAAAPENGHVVVPATRLKKGPNVVDFTFIAGDEPLNRGDQFLYSLFVPARASMAMPCFDQPNLKGRWTLTLDIPSAWVALSNGRESGRVVKGNRASLLFDETEPLPPSLFAFAAGRFSVETATRDGRTLRMFHRETDAATVARNRERIFDQHARALTWMRDYTGIDYPFGKLDVIAIPAFPLGGMEHPGAVYYNASTVLLDESATAHQELTRANTIAHATAHMWFGDLVTMTWFDDVWMNEAFANVLAAKIVNASFPSMNHELRFLVQNYPGAYDVDRTDGSNAIRQDLANLNDAASLYGAIIDQKAPIVMRQLERILGTEAFRASARAYLAAHRFGNADWHDVIAVLDARTPVDLAAWSRVWVDEPGRPTVRTDLQVKNGVVTRLAFVQSDPRGRPLVWPQHVQVAVGLAHAVRVFDVSLDSAEVTVPDAVGMNAPLWVLPIGAGLGYGFFDVDAATLAWLTTSLHLIADPLTRGAAAIVLWEAMLEGRVPAADVLNTLLTALPVETDELNLQLMLDDTKTAFWRFTPADDRADISARLEGVLRGGLNRARTASEKSAWFGALRNVALAPASIEWLYRVWQRKVRIPGLPLSETDDADLALDLAVRDVPTAEGILAVQLQRFQNPDRKARFAFIMPAVSRDVATREQFFQTLRDVKHRDHEAWVVDAARYLHHPLRAGTSRILVRPALDLLNEIQKTGDIFFPQRWTDATLGGYQSVRTAADVRAFIDDLPPNYPPRLKLLLLSAADPLLRAATFQQ